MKLIIQIPCYNEEKTLPQVLEGIPKKIDGVSIIETLVIDDGSSDMTQAVARAQGVNHIIVNKSNMGLGKTFRRGIDACLLLGADIIVNTDGDNQYNSEDIAKLVKPIVDGKADVVIGDREIQSVEHFSPFKKLLQRLGSYVVRKVSKVDVPDAVSGFRAFSKEAAQQLNIISVFSYTIEMLIQIGHGRISYTSVPIRTNPKTRESRLFQSIPEFITKSVIIIIRTYIMHKPLKVFFGLGFIIAFLGLLPIVRFLFFFLLNDYGGHVQSLILGSVLFLVGFMIVLIGLVADLISYNRQLIEQCLTKLRKLEDAGIQKD
ncbi:MAG: glycosyltransferase [Alphaproteobacteria bacterium]|nr:glycosyltransferase [Alphaproteobacteria bacterium]